MKAFIVAAGVAALASVITGTARSAERSVIVPKDNVPFKARLADIVRLTGKGIAGARITAAIEGPAKVEAENNIAQRAQGNSLLGMHLREFEIKATAQGHVKVTITVTPPQPRMPPELTTYEYDVE
jgi:hypothetical protein